MGDERPGHAQDARVALQMAIGQFGEFAVKPGRQIVDDFADLLFDDREIIDQPLGRGRDRAFVADGTRDGAVALRQEAVVFADAGKKFFRFGTPGGGALGDGQAYGMLLEPFEAEQFGADRFVRSIHAPQPVGAKNNKTSFPIVPLPAPLARGMNHRLFETGRPRSATFIDFGRASIFAARIKSLLESPPTSWVDSTICSFR